jgi:hypothetical protein
MNKYPNKNFEDLRGMTFNRLKVLEFDSIQYSKNKDARGRIQSSPLWKCQCMCENKKIVYVNSKNLKSGKVKSCGCTKSESGKNKRKYNKYNLNKEYGIGYTSNTDKEFLFDLEDYDKIKEYYWFEEANGYIISPRRDNYKIKIRLHRLIMNMQNLKLEVDHINRNKLDNRKENLRICTHSENSYNKNITENNNSGFIGVYWSKKDKSWYSQISYNKKHIHLGYTKTKEQAIINRLQAELKYFGEFAPQKELFKEYGITQ